MNKCYGMLDIIASTQTAYGPASAASIPFCRCPCSVSGGPHTDQRLDNPQRCTMLVQQQIILRALWHKWHHDTRDCLDLNGQQGGGGEDSRDRQAKRRGAMISASTEPASQPWRWDE